MEGISFVRSLHAGAFNGSLPNVALPLPSLSGERSILSLRINKRHGLSCVKATQGSSEQIAVSSEKKTPKNGAFPNGFETLVLDVCDGTDISELKLKVGGFEMHVRRNVGETKSPLPPPPPLIVSPTTAPPIPSEPMTESIPATPPSAAAKPSSQASSGPSMKKLAELEAAGMKSYALVSSPTVGLFRSGRMIKGKRQRPSFKEGDLIDEGQIIGYLDQLGSELPVKSDVAGEVLKILCKDGDAVGYGDPLVAVLPSFHSTIL